MGLYNWGVCKQVSQVNFFHPSVPSTSIHAQQALSIWWQGDCQTYILTCISPVKKRAHLFPSVCKRTSQTPKGSRQPQWPKGCDALIPLVWHSCSPQAFPTKMQLACPIHKHTLHYVLEQNFGVLNILTGTQDRLAGNQREGFPGWVSERTLQLISNVAMELKQRQRLTNNTHLPSLEAAIQTWVPRTNCAFITLETSRNHNFNCASMPDMGGRKEDSGKTLWRK